jgi:hypothetical protein
MIDLIFRPPGADADHLSELTAEVREIASRLSVLDAYVLAENKLAIAIDPRAVRKRLREVETAQKEKAEAIAARDAAKSEAAEITAKAHEEVAAIHEEARRRLETAEAAEQQVEFRERRVAALESHWRLFGEPPDVQSGLRNPEHSPLQKARMAHGLPPGRDPDPLRGMTRNEPDAAPAMRIDEMSDTHDDPHADRHGQQFLGSLTRSIDHKATSQ